MTLLSMRQYAKHRGVSPEAVSKAVQKGRISTVTTEDGKRLIDPEKADQEWAANTQNTKRQMPTRAEKAQGKTRSTQVEDEEPAAPAAGTPGQSQGGPSYAQSRAIREAYAARLAKLEFEEKSGRLVAVDRVKVEAFRTARTVRDAVLNIPDRIAAELASYGNDPARIHERLTQELVQSLEELVNAAKRSG